MSRTVPAALPEGWSIGPGDPLDPGLALLHRRHTAAMHEDTPPESIHMLPASALAAPGIRFYILRDADGVPAGMGALKELEPGNPGNGSSGNGHAEIKSMHVLAELRGRGLARALLDFLTAEAKAAGYNRLSLETGAQASFSAARALYLAAGFHDCAPFASYRPDPNSVFMTRSPL